MVDTFPSRMAARLAVAPLVASPATWDGRPLLQAVPVPARSPEGTGDPSAGRSRPTAPTLTAAETDRLIEEVLARHTQSVEALDAFEDLNHGLLLAREKDQRVPCLGPGADAWTSDDATDQELAADLCLLCSVFALCQRYADTANPGAGTWAGVTRRTRRRQGPRPPQGPKRPRGVPADCVCGCGGTTKGGWYLTGHDSMHLANLRVRVRARRLSIDQALAEVAHSERLQDKFRKSLGV